MTTVLIFQGIQNGTATSITFVGDSRRSYEKKKLDDRSQKVFCGKYCIFGFCGEFKTTGQLARKLSTSHVLPPTTLGAKNKIRKIASGFKPERTHLTNQIAIGWCCGHKKGNPFGLCILEYNRNSKVWTFRTDHHLLKDGRIKPLAIGQGTKSFNNFAYTSNNLHLETATTSEIFVAFTEFVRSNIDPTTGGVPQIVTIGINNSPHVVGVKIDGKYTVYGNTDRKIYTSTKEWRNEKFAFLSKTRQGQPAKGNPKYLLK